MKKAPARIEVNFGQVLPDEPEWLEKLPDEAPNGPPWVMYVLATEAERLKRERDRCLAALRHVRDRSASTDADDFRVVNEVIAACEAGGDDPANETARQRDLLLEVTRALLVNALPEEHCNACDYTIEGAGVLYTLKHEDECPVAKAHAAVAECEGDGADRAEETARQMSASSQAPDRIRARDDRTWHTYWGPQPDGSTYIRLAIHNETARRLALFLEAAKAVDRHSESIRTHGLNAVDAMAALIGLRRAIAACEADEPVIYFSRFAVRQLMIDVSAGSVPQETIDLCRAEGVDPHDALQMGWAAACFKLKALMDALDPAGASDD